MQSGPEELRMNLGEEIPPGGTETDTLFTDAQIEELVGKGGGNSFKAAFFGWVVKASKLANMANRSTGTSRTDFSNLHAQALKQIELFRGLSSSGSDATAGRTRVGSIRRTEGGAR